MKETNATPKLLSVAVPCYNSQEYMRKCIHSLLPAGDEIEILIVDDGSTDDTAKIADEFAQKYPGIVRAIHQKNGGHGAAVNTGIKNASGLFFKVVDSDDWVNPDALAKLLRRIKKLNDSNTSVDMIIANFIYDKVGEKRKRIMRFTHVFPKNTVFGWSEMGHMNQIQYMLMHNIYYRTQLLRDCGLKLPRHTFYVDNIFAFQPLPFVKKIYYIDADIYHYFIGRADQSVSEEVMIERIDQQIKVNKIMVDIMTSQDFSGKSARLRKYMTIYLDKVTTVTSAILSLDGSKEATQKKKAFWRYVKNHDSKLYYRLRNTPLGMATNLPGKSGRMITKMGYKTARKIVGFN